VTSRLRTGKTITFFTVIQLREDISSLRTLEQKELKSAVVIFIILHSCNINDYVMYSYWVSVMYVSSSV
jgi:hypothetical protein